MGTRNANAYNFYVYPTTNVKEGTASIHRQAVLNLLQAEFSILLHKLMHSEYLSRFVRDRSRAQSGDWGAACSPYSPRKQRPCSCILFVAKQPTLPARLPAVARRSVASSVY